jgi:hypothetical protein
MTIMMIALIKVRGEGIEERRGIEEGKGCCSGKQPWLNQMKHAFEDCNINNIV